MNIDLLIFSLIVVFVGVYAVFRYIEEKKKYKKNYIPMLKSYLEKYKEEKKYYQERANNFKEKLEIAKNNIEKIKKSIDSYKWTEEDIDELKKLKGTEFETVFTGILEVLGYQITQPSIYKDCNIDFIINTSKTNICVDFIDYKKAKELNEDTLKKLIEGKKKYNCKDVWIITNTEIDKENKEKIKEYGIKLITLEEIIENFPSIRIYFDYFDEKTVYHNYELLYKETYDEVIRRNEWIDEINRKIEKFQKSDVSNLSN